jgi:hypothetical protein
MKIMNGKELKEEFKSKYGLSEMNGNITNYSEWLEDKLIALTKAENLPISGVRISVHKEGKFLCSEHSNTFYDCEKCGCPKCNES